MPLRWLPVTALCACLPLWAQSDYNYLEAHYQSIEPDVATASDSDGYALSLSAPLEPGTFIRGEYGRLKADQGGSRRKEWRAGIGMYTAWMPDIDLLALLTYEEVDAGAGDETGFGAEAGLRWQASPTLEFNGGGRYRDLDDSGNAKVWYGGLVFELSPGLALSGRYENDEGFTRWLAGLRFLQK